MRRLKNHSEERFRVMADLTGWEITKRGWPDFWCRKDDRLILVEVKPNNQYGLKSAQEDILHELSKYGVLCFRWSPRGGFQQRLPEGWRRVDNPLSSKFVLHLSDIRPEVC